MLDWSYARDVHHRSHQGRQCQGICILLFTLRPQLSLLKMHSTSNSGQMGTHVRRCHLGICIQCKKCGVHSFCTCNMMKHLKVVHANDAHVFYDDMPDLSGMQAQDVSHKCLVINNCYNANK